MMKFKLYAQNNKWRIISGTLLAGGVYYYFRDYIELFLSLNQLAISEEQTPKTRNLATILANADSFSDPTPNFPGLL